MGYRNGRYFKDYRARELKELLSSYPELKLLDIWKSNEDLGEASLNELIHVLVKKTENQEE